MRDPMLGSDYRNYTIVDFNAIVAAAVTKDMVFHNDGPAETPKAAHDRMARGRRPVFQDDDAGDTCPCAQCQRPKLAIVPGAAP